MIPRHLEEALALNALSTYRVAPPATARRIAARALKVRAQLPPSRRGGLSTTEAGRQGIGSGVKRAQDIAAGRNVDAMQVHRFYARWDGKIAEERAKGRDIRTSKTVMADDLWGGAPMRDAARKVLDKAGVLPAKFRKR